jgi:hypothetical protein
LVSSKVDGFAAHAEDCGMARRARHVEYAQRFAENRIDLSVLPDLSDQDLEKMGIQSFQIG